MTKVKLARATDEAASLKKELSETKQRLNKVSHIIKTPLSMILRIFSIFFNFFVNKIRLEIKQSGDEKDRKSVV